MPKRNLFFIIFAVFAGMLAWLARDHGGHGRRFAEVLATVEQRYVEPVNSEQMFAAAMNGLFSSLDEHSSFISGTLKEDLNISLDQEFGGVGLELTARDNLIEVQSPIVRSPAWSAGIVAGDIIESVDGHSTTGWSLSEVVAALRGTPGTVVTLGLSSATTDPAVRTLDPAKIISSKIEKKTVSLIREQVLVESVLGDRRLPDGSWNWWIQSENNVALLRILQFGERTPEEVRDALQAIARRCTTDGVAGIVIDLRNNGGGLLESAVDVCDLFLDTGVIVSTQSKDGTTIQRRATPELLVPGVPIVVLINELTASASEIVAACLHDNKRATIAGSRSFGKGTVQSLIPLSDESGMLKLTTSEYLRPNMMPLHRDARDDAAGSWGVEPSPDNQITPTGQQEEATKRWWQHRDTFVFPDDRPSCCAAPSRMTVQLPRNDSYTLFTGPSPREADVVLSKGLDVLLSNTAGAQ